MVEYTDIHRAFLQALVVRGTLSTEQAIQVLQDIINERKWILISRKRFEYSFSTLIFEKKTGSAHKKKCDRDLVAKCVKSINTALAPVQQRVDFVQMEADIPYSEFVVFVSDFK